MISLQFLTGKIQHRFVLVQNFHKIHIVDSIQQESAAQSTAPQAHLVTPPTYAPDPWIAVAFCGEMKEKCFVISAMGEGLVVLLIRWAKDF